MKKLDLEVYGVEEISEIQMNKIEGGISREAWYVIENFYDIFFPSGMGLGEAATFTAGR